MIEDAMDLQTAAELLQHAATPRAQCQACRNLIVTDYCYTCRELYRLGHAGDCKAEFAWRLAGQAAPPPEWRIHWGHYTALSPAVLTALGTSAPPPRYRGRMETPTTVKRLYQLATGDTASHQRRIDAQFRRLTPARQAIIRARLAGQTLSEIAQRLGTSHGTIASHISRSMEKVRKAIAGEPRYRTSRKRSPAN